MNGANKTPRLLSFRDGARLWGHPVHAMLVHFPLAIWLLVFPLQIAGMLGWADGWRAAYWANVAALGFALPTALAGLLDFVKIREPRTSAIASRHMYVVSCAALIFLGEALVRGGEQVPVGARAFLNLGLSLCGSLVLTWGAWLGGELVFRRGVGSVRDET
jgi:uncharacterized membrane protein